MAADTVCEVAGWGTIDHSGRRPDRLQQLERPVISRDVCNHRTRHDGTITKNMMCTDSRRKDTCKVQPRNRGTTAGPSEGWEGARRDNVLGVTSPVLAAAEVGDELGCPSKALAILMSSGPPGRLRWPPGLRRGGRGGGHGRLPCLRQLQETGHLHPHRPVRRLDRQHHGLCGAGGRSPLRTRQGTAPCHGLLLPARPEHPQCCPAQRQGLPSLPTPLPERPPTPGAGLGQGTGEEPRKGVPGPPLTKHRAQVGENWGSQSSTGFAEGAQNAARDCCNKVMMMMIPAELLGWRSGGNWGASAQGGAGHGVGDAEVEPLGMAWPWVGAGDTSCGVATMGSRSGTSRRVVVRIFGKAERAWC